MHDRFGHPNRPQDGGDVVAPDDASSLGDRPCERGKRALQTLLETCVEHASYERLARCAYQQRISQCGDFRQTAKQREALLAGLGEAESGIEQDRVALQPQAFEPLGTGVEVSACLLYTSPSPRDRS